LPDCGQECFLIETKYESYTVDKPLLPPQSLITFTPLPGYSHESIRHRLCPDLTDAEAEERVAEEVRKHNRDHSIQRPSCPQGCKCVPYETPQAPVPLKSRPERKKVEWTAGYCLYVVYFTVSVKETRTAVGFCRPE
jgi:hypothetical protein